MYATLITSSGLFEGVLVSIKYQESQLVLYFDNGDVIETNVTDIQYFSVRYSH